MGSPFIFFHFVLEERGGGGGLRAESLVQARAMERESTP